MVVPNASTASIYNQNAFSSHWIGIGDVDSICQVGVESDGDIGDKSDIYLWYEWYPDSQQRFNVFTFEVKPGDMLQFSICLSDPSQDEITGATVSVTNRRAGIYTTFGITGTPLNNNSAEWISEVPAMETAIGPIADVDALADFGEVFFSDCEASSTKGVALPSGDGFVIDMVKPDPNDPTN